MVIRHWGTFSVNWIQLPLRNKAVTLQLSTCSPPFFDKENTTPGNNHREFGQGRTKKGWFMDIAVTVTQVLLATGRTCDRADVLYPVTYFFVPFSSILHPFFIHFISPPCLRLRGLKGWFSHLNHGSLGCVRESGYGLRNRAPPWQ